MLGRICRHGHIPSQNFTQLVQIFVFEDVLWINYTTGKTIHIWQWKFFIHLFIGFSVRTLSSQNLGCPVLLSLIETSHCSLKFCVHSELCLDMALYNPDTITGIPSQQIYHVHFQNQIQNACWHIPHLWLLGANGITVLHHET